MIAEVALNLPLRRIFDYILPGGIGEEIVPGCRVIVPFGSRVRSGIVVGLKASSTIPPDKLKAVLHPAEATVLFHPEMLEFTRWISDYYFCGWGEVLEAALPSGMSARFRTRYRWRAFPPSPKALKGLSLRAREGLAELPEWEDSRWKRLAEGNTDRSWLWRQIKAGGAVEASYEYAGTKARHRTERWVRLAEDAPPPPSRRRGKDETRKEIVLRILRQDGETPIARLKTLMKDPGSVVRQLAAAGMVILTERPAGHSSPNAPAATENISGTISGDRTGNRPEEPPEEFLTLNPEQQTAWDAIRTAIHAAIPGGKYQGFLLEGVTGSGKTEVYLHAVREVLSRGRGSLVLVPEIALTATMVDRFRSRFGAEVALLHSGLSEGERFTEWNRVREGRANIVIGPRSAVFAPLKNLGLVIVDEEHDTSYKQEDSPRYNGRDTAMMRALRNGAVAVLGSATPSMEAGRNVALGKLTRLHLPRRVKDRPLPPVQLLDLRTTPRQQGCTLFTKPLVQALRNTLLRKEQAILFLNRRGFGTLVRCGACGEDLLCDHCSITLTYHRSRGRLLCHRCDFNKVLPERCPACDAPALELLGLGTERIEQEVALLFPKARVLRMDSDTLRHKGELDRMLAAIRGRHYDVIIGTQVLSKGHDYPFITLVAAVLADVSLNIPDFRAPERTFQILTQMAGRAGRGDQPGQVFIQTYNPEHYSLTHVRLHDTIAFTAEESAIRQASSAPPYASQALLWISAPKPEAAEALAGRSVTRLKAVANSAVRILGPVEAPIRKINNRYRWMLLLKASTIAPIHQTLAYAFAGDGLRPGPRERIAVDVDPYNLL